MGNKDWKNELEFSAEEIFDLEKSLENRSKYFAPGSPRKRSYRRSLVAMTGNSEKPRLRNSLPKAIANSMPNGGSPGDGFVLAANTADHLFLAQPPPLPQLSDSTQVEEDILEATSLMEEIAPANTLGTKTQGQLEPNPIHSSLVASDESSKGKCTPVSPMAKDITNQEVTLLSSHVGSVEGSGKDNNHTASLSSQLNSTQLMHGDAASLNSDRLKKYGYSAERDESHRIGQSLAEEDMGLKQEYSESRSSHPVIELTEPDLLDVDDALMEESPAGEDISNGQKNDTLEIPVDLMHQAVRMALEAAAVDAFSATDSISTDGTLDLDTPLSSINPQAQLPEPSILSGDSISSDPSNNSQNANTSMPGGQAKTNRFSVLLSALRTSTHPREQSELLANKDDADFVNDYLNEELTPISNISEMNSELVGRPDFSVPLPNTFPPSPFPLAKDFLSKKTAIDEEKRVDSVTSASSLENDSTSATMTRSTKAVELEEVTENKGTGGEVEELSGEELEEVSSEVEPTDTLEVSQENDAEITSLPPPIPESAPPYSASELDNDLSSVRVNFASDSKDILTSLGPEEWTDPIDQTTESVQRNSQRSHSALDRENAKVGNDSLTGLLDGSTEPLPGSFNSGDISNQFQEGAPKSIPPIPYSPPDEQAPLLSIQSAPKLNDTENINFSDSSVGSGTSMRNQGEGRALGTLGAVANLAPVRSRNLNYDLEKNQVAGRKRKKSWFEEIFDEDYLQTLPTRSNQHINKEVDFLEESLQPSSESQILDLGCGAGTHAIELACRGYHITGYDLSLPLLMKAADEAQRQNIQVNFIRGDFRDLSFEEQYDAVYCIATTFGYFDDDANRKMIHAISRALRIGGRLLIDVINRDYIIRDLPSRIWWEGVGCVVLEEVDFNYFTSRLISKRSVVFEDGRHLDQEISVRTYSLHELGKILHHAGFRVLEVTGHMAHRTRFFGNYSRSLVLLAEKRPQ